MPKQVDHQARRLALLDAMWRITRREGWDAITLRKLAAEAGVSMGMVQHYFTTKDEMLRFAVEMMAEDTRQRVRERIARLPQPHTPRRLLETALTEMIPDVSRRSEEAEAADVWLRRFMLRPEHTTALARGGADLIAFLVQQIRLGRGGTDADAQAAAERDAGGLIAMLDGLIFNMVVRQQTTESAIETMRTQLDFVLGIEDQQEDSAAEDQQPTSRDAR